MKLILKLIAAPFVVLLTVLVAVLPQTKSIFTHTSTTIPRPLTVPGSSATFGDLPLPCGGSLTACVWKTDCLSWKIPSPEARASFGITGNGWPDGKGR